MEMSGEQRIDAPRDRVWAALNDPEVLRQCIPGCQSLDKVSDDRMRAVAAVKVGPIGARFTGDVTLSEIDPPNGYRIEGEGQGGAAGFVKGGAQVRLTDDGQATLVTYEVAAQVGGKLAQVGGPIVDATAKQMAAAFFRKLSDVVAPPPEAHAPAALATQGGASASAAASGAALASAAAGFPSAGDMPIVWILTVLVAMLTGVLLGRGGALGWAAMAVLLVVVAAAAYRTGRGAKGPRA